MNAEPQPIYRFAGFSLDTRAGVLRDGSGEIAPRPRRRPVRKRVASTAKMSKKYQSGGHTVVAAARIAA